MEISKDMVKAWSVLIFICWGLASAAQPGHKISMKVNGIADTVAYLGHYYGDKQYVRDTVAIDKNGNFAFDGTDTLPGGIYMAILPGKKYFEFVVTEQHFSLETDTADFIDHMKIKNSYENDRFYAYLRFMKKKGEEMQAIQKEQAKAREEKKPTKKADEKMQLLNKEVQAYKNKMIAEHPKAFVSKVFETSKEVEVPEPPVGKDGHADSLFRYRYYKAHYFDHIDFSDDRLLRTPLLHNKIETYMTKLTVQIPDSINKEADYLVGKAMANKELFKYVVHFITNHYERSKYMGMDAVFVHMALNYYTKELAYWVSEAQLARIKDRAVTLNRLLIGKVAPNVVLKDLDGNYQVLHQVKADYVILYFWDPDCGHCKKATPKLRALYEKVKDKGVKVFAVCTEVDQEKWKKFIEEHNLDWINVADLEAKNPFRAIYDISSTPKTFLLNSKKEIIAKNLEVEQLEEFLKRELGEF